MKNTVAAIKYALSALRVSPNELFSLIESSQGYIGSDYKRWLSSQIINIAEKEGIGFSQLLVKKLSISQEITQSLDVSIRKEWVDYVKTMCIGNTIVVNFEEFGSPLEGINWYSGADLLCMTNFYDSLKDKINTNIGNCLIAKLESEPCSKDDDLVKSAKENGVICKSHGALLLYRMCNLIQYNEFPNGLSFVFFASAGFLGDADNAGVIEYFLRYYRYIGFAVDSSDLLSDVNQKNTYVFCVCLPRTPDDLSSDCIAVPKMTLLNNKVVFKSSRNIHERYSRSSNNAFTELFSKHTNAICSMVQADLTLSVSSDLSGNYFVSEANLKDAVVCFSAWHAMRYGGFSQNITSPMSGSINYDELFFNCLPFFLFSPYSNFKKNSILDPFNSEMIKSLLEQGEVYFSYEAKELVTICKGFVEFLGDNAQGKSFNQIRSEINHSGLNDAYRNALDNLMGQICIMYRKMM